MNAGEAAGLSGRRGGEETGWMSEIPVACCAGTNIGPWALRPGTLSGGLSSNRGCKRVDVGGVPYVPFPSTNCISPSFPSFSLAPWSASSSGGAARCAQNSGSSVKRSLAVLETAGCRWKSHSPGLRSTSSVHRDRPGHTARTPCMGVEPWNARRPGCSHWWASGGMRQWGDRGIRYCCRP